MKIWALFFFLFCFSFCCSLKAQDAFWTNNAGGDFETAGNWINGVPNSSSNAFFTNSATYTVNWSTDPTNANSYVNRGTVTFNIGSSTYFVTNSLILGQAAGTGTVSHTTGTAVVTNAAKTASFVVGSAGRGIFTFNGGTVKADKFFFTNAVAAADVTFNSGTLTVNNGSTYLTNDFALGSGNGNTMTVNFNGGVNETIIKGGGTGTLLGDFPLSTTGKGVVTVTGSGTVWSNSGDFYIRNMNEANTLMVTNGAKLFSSATYLGSHANSTNNGIVLTGAGSSWMVTNTTGASVIYRLGDAGASHTLKILDGASLLTGDGRVGAQATSTKNFVLIAGEGSIWCTKPYNGSTGVLTVGTDGGTVLVTNSGTLEVQGALTSGAEVSGQGSMTNRGGVFQFVSATPTITANSPIVITNGSLAFRAIANAPVVLNNQLTNMTYQGANTYVLNNASNTMLSSYTFTNLATVAGATNFVNLTLKNGSPTFNCTNMILAAGGNLMVTNCSGAIVGAVRVSGSGKVTGGSLLVTK